MAGGGHTLPAPPPPPALVDGGKARVWALPFSPDVWVRGCCGRVYGVGWGVEKVQARGDELGEE
eukprot:144357-Chlamydomonas_euryale.AAC.1